MIVSDLLAEDRIIPDLVAVAKGDVLGELASLMEASLPDVPPGSILEVIREREEMNSTAIGSGVALPHGRLPGLQSVMAGFARSKDGVDFGSTDGGLTHLFFVLLAPIDSAGMHLKALAGVSRLLKADSFRAALIDAPADEILFLIRAEEGAA